MSSATYLLPESTIKALNDSGAPWRFSTVRVADDHLGDDLAAAGEPYIGVPESTWITTLPAWVVPALLVFAVWSFFLRCAGSVPQGFTGIAKSKPTLHVQQETGVSFDDIVGIDEAKAELKQIVEFLCNPEHYRRLGGKIPRGALGLSGASMDSAVIPPRRVFIETPARTRQARDRSARTTSVR